MNRFVIILKQLLLKFIAISNLYNILKLIETRGSRYETGFDYRGNAKDGNASG